MIQIKNYKKLTIALFILVIFLIQIPILADSNSLLFLRDPELASADNFEAISDADHSTKWTLTPTDDSESMDLQDDIASGYWDLYDVGSRYMSIGQHLSDNYLLDNYSITSGWVYSGTHWDTSVQYNTPKGIVWDGTYFWTAGTWANAVRRYYSDGTYSDYAFDFSYYDANPEDIAYKDNHLYVIGNEHNRVYKFTTGRMWVADYLISTDGNPTGIVWDGTYFWIVGQDNKRLYRYNSAFGDTGFSINLGAQGSEQTGVAWDGTHLWVTDWMAEEVYQYDPSTGYTGVHFDTSSTVDFLDGITWDGSNFWLSDSYLDEIFQYEKEYSISKNYYGGGYAYMQTSTTETVGLISPTYGSPYNLSSGDYFKINCKPQTSNKIELKLYNNSILQKTLTVIPQDNTNYNTRNIEVSVNEYIEFDRLLFTGTLEDTDYFKVFDVKTYKYPPSLLIYWLSGYERRLLSIPDYEYTLKIYDNDIMVVEKNITLTSSLHTEIYTPISTVECRLSLFSQENIPLEFSLYHINITRTLNNVTDTYPLLNSIFTVDIGTIVNTSIWDRFGNSIKNDSRVSTSFIDIELDIYSLKISHRGTEESSITIQTNGSEYIITELVTPEELVEYQLAPGTYNITWFNGENDEITLYVITFTEDYLLILDSIYRDIYFSVMSEDGEAVSENDIDFYINGTRCSLGFNTIESRYVNITILDVFNFTIYSSIIDTDGITQVIIYLDIYSLNILNLYTFQDILVIISEKNYEYFIEHYPATYSFYFDDVGSEPAGWTSDNDVGSTTTIIASLDGHKKVLQLYDGSVVANEGAHIGTTFAGQITGTVEWFFRTSDKSKKTEMFVGNTRVHLYISNDIRYYDGTPVIIQTISNDQWYHIRIDFDCDTDTFDCYIDGIKKVISGSFEVSTDTITDFIVCTEYYSTEVGLYVWIDAVAYSWDSDYNIGNNYYHQWYPGTFDFESDDVSTSGHYYGAESDALSFIGETGLIGTAIEFVDTYTHSATSYQAIVSTTYAGHYEILNLTSSNDGYVASSNSFAGKTSGTIEYWQNLPSGGVGGSTYIGGTGGTATYPTLDEVGGGRIIIPYGDGLGGTIEYVDNTYTVGDWVHFKFVFDCEADTFDMYVNGCLVIDDENFYNDLDLTDIDWVRSQTPTAGLECYYDAFGYSWDETYTVGDNCNPYGLPTEVSDFIETYYFDPYTSVSVISYLDGHKKVLNLTDDNICGTIRPNVMNSFSQASGIIEFWIRTTDNTKASYIGLNPSIQLYICGGNLNHWNGSGYSICAFTSNIWHHLRIDFDCGTDTYDLYFDCSLELDDEPYWSNSDAITSLEFNTQTAHSGFSTFLDAIAYSWDTSGTYYYWTDDYFNYYTSSNYTIGHNLEVGVIPTGDFDYGDINISEVISQESLNEYRLHAQHNYTISTYYTNNSLITAREIRLSINSQIESFGTMSKTCFLSYADQRGIYLEFNNYKTYIDGVLIYENIIVRMIGVNLSIEIKDRYDISISNSSYVVVDGDNFISVTLTMHSLKIYNQQELFNWVNITRDPNYYESENYWSEWLAPNEITEYMLFEGYYKVNVTRVEEESSSVYSYHLVGDDMLLITSDNTITNAIINIQNVNTTLGNQITNVEINITNQNTSINQSVINVDINLSNINCTLGDLLLSQNIQLTNIGNNISTLFVYIENNFTTLGNNINMSFIDLNTSIFLVNNSIYTAINVLEANLFMINNSISGNVSIILLQNDFLTAIYTKTMFSELLNWSGLDYNYTIMEDRIDLFNFINEYRNQSVEVLLKYKDKIDSMIVSAQESLEQWLPKQDVEYRLKSVATGGYLSEWEDLINRTVDFGFYETEIDPGPIMVSFTNIVILFFFFTIFAIIIVVLFIRFIKTVKYYPIVHRSKKKKRKSTYNSRVYR